jgi:hypothetical protein
VVPPPPGAQSCGQVCAFSHDLAQNPSPHLWQKEVPFDSALLSNAATPTPTEAAASATAIIVIRTYFIVSSIYFMSLTGCDVKYLSGGGMNCSPKKLSEQYLFRPKPHGQYIANLDQISKGNFSGSVEASFTLRNFKLCRKSVGKFHVMPDRNFI